LEKLKEASFANEITDKITLTFRTSTGCRWADKIKCTFCGLNTISKHTHMSNNKARNYIDWLIEKYSKDFPFFMAVDLTLPHNYPRDVFLKQKNVLNNTVIYEVRADLSKEDMIILKNAGVTILQPGIESLSTETLKRMHKGTTSFTNIQFLKNALEIGIYPVWLWLYGLPDEVDSNIFEDMTRTLELIKHLPPPTATDPIIFTRFSSYFDQSTEYGLELKPASFYSLLYPYNDDVIAQLAYHFSDQKRKKPYVDAYMPHQGVFGAMILDWIVSFYNANKNPPMLIFDNNKIIDTRSKRRTEYYPSITGREMLQFLDTPRSLIQIEKNFTDYRKTLDDLVKRGFIFEDREKYMSLVCSKINWNNSEYKRFWNFVNSSTLRPIPFHSFQKNST
jgi:magnesium-protoporphyrin IX monomethyl ester (oxidative) cyclase